MTRSVAIAAIFLNQLGVFTLELCLLTQGSELARLNTYNY